VKSPRRKRNADAAIKALGYNRAALALDLSPQGVGGKGFAVVTLGHYAPVRAEASPFLDKQDAAEQVRLHVEPVKAAHISRRIDAAKIHGGHGSSLAIVQRLTS
jgi:hypothetical protein